MSSSPPHSRSAGPELSRLRSPGEAARTPPLLSPAPTGEWQDHAILYGAGAAALFLPLITWGLAAGNPLAGLAGALLVTVGVSASAYLSRLRVTVAVPVGLALGILVGWAWWLAANRGVAVDELMPSAAAGDAAIVMAQRMCALVLAISFWMVRPAVVGFALVPGLTVFGLTSGRLEGISVVALFCGFIGLSLVVLAWAMLAPEEMSASLRQARTAPGQVSAPASPPRRFWRTKHLLTVGSAFALCLVLGYGLSLPMVALSAVYRWPLLIRMTPEGSERLSFIFSPAGGTNRFPVGTGPQPLRDTPVLSVSGEPAQYWRGAVYDQYTGSAWQRWQSEIPVPIQDHAPGSAEPRSAVVDLSQHFRLPPGAHLRTHEVQAEMDQPFVIYSPGRIQRAVLPLPESAPYSLQTDPFGDLELPGATLTAGDTYQVVSAPLGEEGPGDSLAGLGRQDASDPALRSGDISLPSRSHPANPAPSRLSPALMPQVYLSVPFTANRVAELAQRVAGPKPTPEEKLEALVRYLQQNYVYSSQAPAVPRGEDAADYFLFRLKRGRCDLFATALALMARSVDIPTRLATGFLEGQYDKETGAYLLRESDRHAWVEAYVPSLQGWITVDPTPGVEEPAGGGPRGWHLVWLQVRFFWQDHPSAGAGMALALVTSVALAFMAIKRRRYAGPRPPAPGPDPRAMVARVYWQFLSLLRRRGLPRRASQTPLELLTALGALVAPSGGADLRSTPLPLAALAPAAALTEIFVTVRYGPGPATEDHAAAARGALKDLRTALRTRPPHLC